MILVIIWLSAWELFLTTIIIQTITTQTTSPRANVTCFPELPINTFPRLGLCDFSLLFIVWCVLSLLPR